ncbi:MAG: hypothetical protein ACLQUW_03190 [Desulfobaccales bacterium]
MLNKKRTLHAFLIIFVIIIGVEIIGLICSPAPPPQEYNEKKTQQKNNASGALIFSPIISNTTRGLACITNWIGNNSGIVIALATIAIAWFTYTLSQTSREQARHMEESIAVAEKAANAAKDSAEALPAIERAYLFVYVSPNMKSKFVIGNNTGMVTINNCGRTPAIIKNIIAISGYFNTPPAICQGEPIPIEPYDTIIAGRPHPDEEKTFEVNFTIKDSDQMEDVIRDNAHMGIFIHGCIQYEDIFRNPQETRFYWRYSYTSHTFIRVEDKERNYQT